MKHVLTLVLILLACVARAVVETAPEEEKLRVASEVRKIFEAKCADCHGDHLPKPKGKFGYVLDLARVGKNPDYVVPGDVKASDLYRMVKENEMPGEDADVPPLTPAELAVVERWVMIGAPGAPVVAAASAQQKGEEPAKKEDTSAQPFSKRLLSWLGKFHPASTHFPIGLLMASVLAEFIAWWRRKPEWTLVVRFLVVLGALGAIPTATLGWLAVFPVKAGSAIATVYWFHRLLGTSVAIWGLICAVLICLPSAAVEGRARWRFRAALLFGAALVSVTGMLGGMLTFGVDHYAF